MVCNTIKWNWIPDKPHQLWIEHLLRRSKTLTINAFKVSLITFTLIYHNQNKSQHAYQNFLRYTLEISRFFSESHFFKLSNALKIFYIPSKYIRCSSLFCYFQFCSILFSSHTFVLLVRFIFLLLVRHASTHSNDL